MAKMVATTLAIPVREITGEDARAYWEARKNEYTMPAMARVRRIVVDTEGQARDILRRLEGGADFGALAERFSRDEATSHRGGETDFFGPGSMQGMADVALEHEPGELIPPFKSQAGWEIVEVLEKTPARLKTFAEVEAVVKTRLAQKRTAEEVDRVIADARRRTAIEIDEAALERMPLPS
jgi:parvulin-like peptidyl-prolyl isomerase